MDRDDDGLRARGLDRDTLVVLTGDHGESFGEPHGNYMHSTGIYEENVAVPLFFWSPALFPHGGRSHAVGAHADLNATLADVLGLPPAADWQGESLLAEPRNDRAYFYAARDDYQLGVRDRDWKYLYDATTGNEQLFDLARDPSELHDVAARDPATCARLKKRLAAWVDRERTNPPGSAK